MIPLKLHIKNFVSYGAQQDIDFEPYSLVCLSGKNGHGKSALLDALSWVLWGQARKASGTAKADEGLLRLGQTHMMVSLDFICNGILYRVKREFSLADKKSQSNLEFGILDKETGTFKALTDKTIRATQAKITKAVGLEFDAFTNSAFLRQGQSHEFSKKSPRERKDILAAILGLEHFESVRRLAMDKAKDALIDKEQAQAILLPLEEELKEKVLVHERLKTIEEALTNLQEREKDLQIEYLNHKKRSQQASSIKVEAEKILFKQDHLARLVEQEYSHIRSGVETWRTITRKQRTESPSTNNERERQKVQEELFKVQMYASQKLKLKDEYLIKREALREGIQKILDTQKSVLEKLDRQAHGIDLSLKNALLRQEEFAKKRNLKTKELDELALLLSQRGMPETNQSALIAIHEKNLERRKAYYHTFISNAQAFKTQLEDLTQKQHLINSAHEAICPLCEQITDKEKLAKKFVLQEKIKSHQLKRLTTVCSSLKAALLSEHASLENLKKEREHLSVQTAQKTEREKQHQALLIETMELTKELVDLSDSLVKLAEQKELIHKEREKLLLSQTENKDPLTLQLEQEVQRIKRDLELIPHDPEKEKTLNEQLTFLSAQSNQHNGFLKELALQDERKKVIYEKCDQIRSFKKQLALMTQEMPERVLSEEQLAQQEQLLSQSLGYLTQEKEGLIHQKGALEAQVAALKQKEYVYKQQSILIKECGKSYEEYTAIASAFSKDGIQALLIEDALPEIEEEANNLLSRLTDNQSHISIESLRDTKSGKTKETLDIKISDAVGVRPYEMFSGGEAFRIDFSLRVALSKLLARRAGTALQTLIIDEGFGSQDEEGLAHIMEALHVIKQDFAKVIIVSHLPSLKEQFPVHFQIHKTPQGSVVEVIEHC